MGSMVSWDPASLTGQGMKNSAEQQMKSAEEPAFPSPKHPPTVSPPPPPGTDRMHLSLLPDPGGPGPLTAYWNFSLYSRSLARALLSSSARE